MKICYFITLHHKPITFQKLWEAIYSPDHLYCIHIDAKASAQYTATIEALVHKPNVTLLPRRSINWGGWSMVQAELDAIKLMLKDQGWTRWINLSGQDHPIKSMEEINQFLALRPSVQFMDSAPFDSISVTEPDDIHLKQNIWFEWRKKTRKIPFLKLPIPTDFRHKGSGWHILTRGFVFEAVTSRRFSNIKRWLRFTFAPDETFWQACASVHFALFVDPSLRYVKWPGPKVFTEVSEAMWESPCLFARKFNFE